MLYTIAIIAGSSIITGFIYYKLTSTTLSFKKIPNTLYLVDDVDVSSSIMSQVIYADKCFLNNLDNIRNDLKTIDVSNSPLKIVLSTNGGAIFNCHRLVKMLKKKDINYIVYIRKYAMSAGTFIALNAKEIVMLEEDSFIGKIDPQIRFDSGQVSAIDLNKAYEKSNKDKLSLMDLVKYQTASNVIKEMNDILEDCNIGEKLKDSVKNELIYSDFPHEHKFDFAYCKDVLGLPVRLPKKEELAYFD